MVDHERRQVVDIQKYIRQIKLLQLSKMMVLFGSGEITNIDDQNQIEKRVVFHTNELRRMPGIQKYIQMDELSLLLKMTDQLQLGDVQIGVDHELQQIQGIQKYIQINVLLQLSKMMVLSMYGESRTLAEIRVKSTL